MLTDTHCHVQVDDFDGDRDEVLARAVAAGVTTLICVGYDWQTSVAAVDLCEARKAASGRSAVAVHATVGLHPHDAKELTPELLGRMRQLCREGKVVAVGECGLDFFRNLSTPEQQRVAFAEQIELAREVDLPLVVHDRDAHEEVLALLREHHASRGVMHCFSGDWEFARRCLDLGFYISIAGPITYKNPRALPEVAAKVPADRLVLETDSPYLSPQAHRGRRNEPGRVRLVAELVAELRGQSLEALAEQTSANARQLFGLGARSSEPSAFGRTLCVRMGEAGRRPPQTVRTLAGGLRHETNLD